VPDSANFALHRPEFHDSLTRGERKMAGSARLMLISCCLLWCALGVARAQPQSIPDSTEFVRNLTQHFSSQIAAARLVQTRSDDAAVKDFAARLAAEYEQASRSLASLCEQVNIDVPPQPEDGRLTSAISASKGAGFDRLYTLEESQELARADALLDAAILSPKVDPKLKDFARKQKDVVRDYRKRAEPLAQRQAGQTSR
jgi:predicted outer membrane protein